MMKGHQSPTSQQHSQTTSILVTMRKFVPEFDPDAGPKGEAIETDPTGFGGTVDLYKAWKMYVQNFCDICHVESVVKDEDKRRLFLLLSGLKLRMTLNNLGWCSDKFNFEDTMSLLDRYFYRKQHLRRSRYDFFFKHGARLDSESIESWKARLFMLAKTCDIENLGPHEAVILLMGHHVTDPSLKEKILLSNATINQVTKFLNAEKLQCNGDDGGHQIQALSENEIVGTNSTLSPGILAGSAGSGDAAEHINVELQWGEDEIEDSDAKEVKAESKLDSTSTSEDINGSQYQLNSVWLVKDEAKSPGKESVTRKQTGPKLTCQCPNCQETPPGVKPEKHRCHFEDCGKEYSKSSHLRAHLASHSRVLPFGCAWPGCGKRFYRSDQLTRHSRIHTGEKRYSCSVCHKAFSRSDHLSKHMKTHNNSVSSGRSGAQDRNVTLPYITMMGHMDFEDGQSYKDCV